MPSNEILDILIGMALDEARKYVLESGYALRVIRRDTVPMIGTRDFRTDRINVELIASM